MLGMKKRTPAGHAAVGIILTAALLFAGGCGTNTQNQTAGSTVSEQTSELTSEQASEQGSGKMAKYVPTKADEVQNPVLYLDGDPVSQEEYAMLAQQYKNQIIMKYSTDQSTSRISGRQRSTERHLRMRWQQSCRTNYRNTMPSNIWLW